MRKEGNVSVGWRTVNTIDVRTKRNNKTIVEVYETISNGELIDL